MSDILSFIVVELIRFFHGALQLQDLWEIFRSSSVTRSDLWNNKRVKRKNILIICGYQSHLFYDVLYHRLFYQWRRTVVKYGGQGQSGQAIKLFQVP